MIGCLEGPQDSRSVCMRVCAEWVIKSEKTTEKERKGLMREQQNEGEDRACACVRMCVCDRERDQCISGVTQ